VGDYLAIDLNAAIFESSAHTFGRYEVVVPVKLVEKDHAIEKRDSNGKIYDIVLKSLEFFGEMAENRERYQASIVDARNSNYTNLRQTSYDIPPK